MLHIFATMNQYLHNEDMAKYVEFICSLIRPGTGAEISNTTGMPMKGAYVPVQIDVVEKMTRSAMIKITALGHSEEFIFYMSRHKGPDTLIFKLQRLVDEHVNIIIDKHGLNRDEIFETYHPFIKKLKEVNARR